jgi:hypothetical protein
MNLEGRKRTLYIHGPDAERFIGDILDLDYWGSGFRVIPKNVPFEGNREAKVLESKDFEITAIPSKHSVPSVAYAFREKDKVNVDIKKAEKLFGLKQGRLVGKLKEKGRIEFKGKKIRLEDVGVRKPGVKVVYSGDTEPCKNVTGISKGADLLIHDATFIESKEGYDALRGERGGEAGEGSRGEIPYPYTFLEEIHEPERDRGRGEEGIQELVRLERFHEGPCEEHRDKVRKGYLNPFSLNT